MWCCMSADSSIRQREREKHGLPGLKRPTSRAENTVCWGDLPCIAHVLRGLSFKERCMAALVCRQWNLIVTSAAAHEPDASQPVDWAASRVQPCDCVAAQEGLHCQLQQCRAIRYASSAAVWNCGTGALHTLSKLQGLTRLHLLDIRCDVEGRQFSQPTQQTPISLQHLQKLRVLNVAMSSPILDFGQLPSSLECLHLNLASGYSVSQLHHMCMALAAASPKLPQLQHISLGLELDALLRNSQGAVLTPLRNLSQLTSLALTDYQHMHPDSPAHEGYTVVPAVLQQLVGLRQVELHMCSGQHAQLSPAAAVPNVRLVLSLARHEQTQFNRLPPSLVTLTGLTSLSILTAEFMYEPDSELFVFDASPLALCQALKTLLLELHGSKCSQHDLRGLAQLRGLEELVVIFKCPDVHEARPEVSTSCGSSSSGAPGSASGEGSSASLGISNWLARTAAALRRPGLSKLLRKGMAAAGAVHEQRGPALLGGDGGAGLGAAPAAGTGVRRGSLGSPHAESSSSSISLLCEEWVLQLLDTALDQLRPEFALSLPHVSGRLMLATTSRLLLRQPEHLTVAREPLLLASHLQLDLDSCGDFYSGQCFLHRMSVGALRGWVGRSWQPNGVELLEAARYPQLASYPGCRQRIDDKLLVAARRGVGGGEVVQAVMSIVEERCMSYFT